MGKLESSPPYAQFSPHYLPYHAHITALTVAPHARRLGLGATLSESLARAGDEYDAYFVDLFVRKSNDGAQRLYRGLGYSVWRTVVGYYTDTAMDSKGKGKGPGGGEEDDDDDEEGGEDAYDMRKSCKRDTEGKFVRKNGERVKVDPMNVW